MAIGTEFTISTVSIAIILVLYYSVPDKDFGISVFFFALLCFSALLGDLRLLVVNDRVLLTANLTPLYVWSLWFIFVHDRYNNSEVGSVVLWVKSLLMLLLLPISHANQVKNNQWLTVAVFLVTSLLFVVPVYVDNRVMDMTNVRQVVAAVIILVIRTVVFLMVYITASLYNGRGKNVVNMNNSLWVLSSSIWLMPVAFLQMGIYLFIYSSNNNNNTNGQPLLPTTTSTTVAPSPRAPKRRPAPENASKSHHGGTGRGKGDPAAVEALSRWRESFQRAIGNH